MIREKLTAKLYLGIILLLVTSGIGYAQGLYKNGPDQAMRAFVSAIKSRNATSVLAAFSKTTPWQNAQYGTDRPGVVANRVRITYGQLSNDFSHHKGWYQQFLGTNPEPEIEGCYTLADIIKKVSKWYKSGNTFGISSGKSPPFYIKWRPEGGKWVIAEIGDTRP
jgi:hypothetical protein